MVQAKESCNKDHKTWHKRPTAAIKSENLIQKSSSLLEVVFSSILQGTFCWDLNQMSFSSSVHWTHSSVWERMFTCCCRCFKGKTWAELQSFCHSKHRCSRHLLKMSWVVQFLSDWVVSSSRNCHAKANCLLHLSPAVVSLCLHPWNIHWLAVRCTGPLLLAISFTKSHWHFSHCSLQGTEIQSFTLTSFWPAVGSTRVSPVTHFSLSFLWRSCRNLASQFLHTYEDTLDQSDPGGGGVQQLNIYI